MRKGDPAIIFSRILSLGIEYDVFSLPEMPPSPEKYADVRGGIQTLFILPSQSSDIRIEIPDLHARRLFSYTPAALSAAKFLLNVRGLPLSEITVETAVGEIAVLSGNDGKCTVLSDRFSVIGEEELLLSGERMRAKLLRTPFGSIRTLNVNSAAGFAKNLLHEASLSREGGDIIGAVAYDGRGEALYHFSRSGEYPSALTAAISAASALYPRGETVKIGEDIFDFSCQNGKFRLSDRARRPLTFYAPALD